MGKSDTNIQSRPLLELTQLAQMNEVIWNEKELEVFTNDFLDEFS